MTGRRAARARLTLVLLICLGATAPFVSIAASSASSPKSGAKAQVRMKLVFDTRANRPDAPAGAGTVAPGMPPEPEAAADPLPDTFDPLPEGKPAKDPSPQPGDAAKGRGMWRGGAGSIDPRMMAAVSVPSEQSALVATVVFHVELTLLDAGERRRLMGEATGRLPGGADAFDALALRGTPCLIVHAEIRNDAREPLSFNPQNILLVTDRPDIVAPLDATRAWEELREARLPAETLLPDLQKVIFDTAMTLKPGESISRLLAFPLPKAGFRRARLDFSFFAIGPASYSFNVPMRPVPVAPVGSAMPGPPAPAGAEEAGR